MARVTPRTFSSKVTTAGSVNPVGERNEGTGGAMSVTNRAPRLRFPCISIVQVGAVPLQAPVQPVK